LILPAKSKLKRAITSALLALGEIKKPEIKRAAQQVLSSQF